MMRYKAACKRCGISPYTKEEEDRLSDNEKVIRQCKKDLVGLCDQLRMIVDVIERMAKAGPESGDAEYVHAITEFRRQVIKIREDMFDITSQEK